MRSFLVLVLLSFLGAFANAAPPTDVNVTVTVGDVERSAIVHLPALPDDGDPPELPVVVNLHALLTNAEEFKRGSGLDKVANKEGFIAVYPNGHGPGWPWPDDSAKQLMRRGRSLVRRIVDFVRGKITHRRSWNGGGCCPHACDRGTDDIAFLRTLLEHLETGMLQNFAVDAERIYVMGTSNGGFMTYRVACEMSDVVAAVSPAAGVLSHTEDQVGVMNGDPFECAGGNQRKIPLLHFHSDWDPLVPRDGGDSLVFAGQEGKHFPNAEYGLDMFRKINGVAGTEGEVVYEDRQWWGPFSRVQGYLRPRTTCTSWGKDTDFPVEYCFIHKRGVSAHCTPGPEGCKTRIGDDYIWNFFKRHTLSQGEEDASPDGDVGSEDASPDGDDGSSEVDNEP